MLSDIGIDGIYVVHAKRGYKVHENRINTLFKANNLDFEFVTDGDPSVFTKELLEAHHIGPQKGGNICTGRLMADVPVLI